MATVGVVGLGAMGSRIARRLGGAGHELVVWNRDPAKAESLVAAGALAAATPADAARRAETVITMVADPRALVDVTEGTDGVVGGLGKGTTLIQTSTVGPDSTSRLAALLPVEALLDSPVLGSVAEVESGTLSVFLGGAPEPVEHWLPVLSTLGTGFPPRAGRSRHGCKARRQHGAGRCDGHPWRGARPGGTARIVTGCRLRGPWQDRARGPGGTTAFGRRERRVPAAVRSLPRAQGRGSDPRGGREDRARAAPDEGGGRVACRGRECRPGRQGLFGRARPHPRGNEPGGELGEVAWIDRVGERVLAVEDVSACLLELLLRAPAPLDGDHGVVGPVADRDRR